MSLVKGATTASQLHELLAMLVAVLNPLYIASWWRPWSNKLPSWPSHSNPSETAEFPDLVVGDNVSSAIVLVHLYSLDAALDYSGENTVIPAVAAPEPSPKKATKKGKKRPLEGN